MSPARATDLTAMSPWGIPLLGLPGMTARPTDAASLGTLIQPFFAPSTMEGQHRDGQFTSTISGLQLGAAALMAIRNTTLCSKGFMSNGVSLLMAYDQPGFFRVEGRDYRVLERPLLMPLCPYEYWADEVRGGVLSLDPAHVVSVAMTMAGSTSDELRQRVEAALQRPELIDLEQGRSRQHFATLQHTLWLADRALRHGDGLSPMLALDDLFTRLLVLLLLPELDGDGSPNGAMALLAHGADSSARGADRALNRVIDWALSDLTRPISLTDIEAYSGYARRTLQKAFQQRFGMGPMQWLRRQRLTQARQLIETNGGKLKLGAIAQSCGYHNPASFSRDFHQVFGVKASDLVRNSRVKR